VEVLMELRRPFSRLKVRISTATGRFHAYIKQYRLREPSEAHRALMVARLQNDYHVTRLLYKRFAAFPRLYVPRPLACFPELLTIVFEESPGENLQELIHWHARGWPSRTTLNRLIEYCEQCGEWLHRFQQVFPREKRYSIVEMWEEVDHRLRQLVANPHAKFSESSRQQVCRYFEKLQARGDHLDLRMAAVHADFCPSNMVVHHRGNGD
jgi:hypothetical protein